MSCLPLQQQPLCARADVEYELDKRWLKIVASVSPPEPRGLCSVRSAVREINSSLVRHTILWFN